MKKIHRLISLGCFFTSSLVLAASSEVGKDLYQKKALEISEVPPSALQTVTAIQPDFKLAEAEHELKHGNQYLDLEGETAQGNEIEFDLLLNKQGQWQVVEIQRDLSLEDCPKAVKLEYASSIGKFPPQRVIESRQMDDVVVYEFYFVKGSVTSKKEIKLEDGVAKLLDKEWQH